MKKRLIINLVLFIVLLALAALVWLKPEQKTTQQPRLVDLDINAINLIHIERAGAKPIKLTKHPQGWRLSAPIDAKALAGKVERLLKISQIKPAIHYPLERDALARFGLQTPVASIYFNDINVLIGKTENVNSRRYATVGKQLFLLDDTFLPHLTAPLSAYIDNRLLPDDVQIISLQTPSLQLQQAADHSWHNVLNPGKTLSADAVQTLFDEWRFARAISVNKHLVTELGDTVSLQLSNQQRLTFQRIEKNNSVLLINPDTQLSYSFSPEKYKQMTSLQ